MTYMEVGNPREAKQITVPSGSICNGVGLRF